MAYFGEELGSIQPFYLHENMERFGDYIRILIGERVSIHLGTDYLYFRVRAIYLYLSQILYHTYARGIHRVMTLFDISARDRSQHTPAAKQRDLGADNYGRPSYYVALEVSARGRAGGRHEHVYKTGEGAETIRDDRAPKRKRGTRIKRYIRAVRPLQVRRAEQGTTLLTGWRARASARAILFLGAA